MSDIEFLYWLEIYLAIKVADTRIQLDFNEKTLKRQQYLTKKNMQPSHDYLPQKIIFIFSERDIGEHS